MKKYLLTVLCSLFVVLGATGQDIHFSQFYENNIMRNPALTGIFSGDYKVGANYRTQWSNISVPFRTFLFSAETRVLINRELGDYLSFGVTGTYDRAGSINFNSMQVYPALNYNKSLEDRRNSYLSVGFTAGYIQRSIDFSKATFSSQYVNGSYSAENISGEDLNNVTIENYDVGAGVSINSSFGPQNMVNYYAGFSAYHLNKPKHTFKDDNALIVLKTKYSANAGFNWKINSYFGLVAHFNHYIQGTYKETIYGGLLSWKDGSELGSDFKLYAGVFFRAKDAFIPTVKVDYEQYSLTLSYDVNTSTLQPATSGSGGYEISLFIRGNYNRRGQIAGSLRCPRFEHMMPGAIGDSGIQ
ncbi:MAG: PorP/SprF family type IX secretion system membrane protein [Chitinophagaceae bacterium]|nr:PorP/SprF family type IX secretion system membrane protein [Chitinophagaceae bacterium]